MSAWRRARSWCGRIPGASIKSAISSFPMARIAAAAPGALDQRPVRSRRRSAVAGRLRGDVSQEACWTRSAASTKTCSLMATMPNWVCARASRAGAAVYAPRAVVRHHRGSTLGKGSARAAGVDRAQSRAAGAEAVSVEPAVAQPVLLCGAACWRARRLPGAARANRAFPGDRRQIAHGAARWSRGDLAALRWRRACCASAPQIARAFAVSRRREVRRLILAQPPAA